MAGERRRPGDDSIAPMAEGTDDADDADDDSGTALRADRPPLGWLGRGLLVAACLGGIAAVLGDYSAWRRHRAELQSRIAATDLVSRVPSLGHDVRYAVASSEADLAVARALVHDLLDLSQVAANDLPATVAERLERLPEARELARRTLERRPASWEAPMLLGAATYLEWSARQDRRLIERAADWEAPLRVAVARAPGAAEPRRFLAAAYLEVWPFLGPERRQAAREVIAATFRDDDDGYRQLLPVWIAAARDAEEVFSLLPPRPEAWRELAAAYATRHDWSRFVAAWEGYLDTLEVDLGERLEEAERRLRFGDLYYGRGFLLRVIVDAPPSRRFAPFVERALAQYPPGLHSVSATAGLAAWLDWALDLALVGHSPLDPRVVGRLAGAAGELETPQAALAALLAGEIAQAESLARQSDLLAGVAWRPYHLAKAQWHLERDEAAAAAATLDTIDRQRREGPLYWLLRERVARNLGDLPDVGDARAALATLRSQEWPSLAWRWRGGRFVAELLPSAPAEGLELDINELPPGGAVIEVVWDGAAVARLPVVRKGPLRLSLPVTEGLHLLEVRPLAGGQVTPGRVALYGAGGD